MPTQRGQHDRAQAHGGVPRRDKIVAIHSTILGLPVDAPLIEAQRTRQLHR